MLQIIHELALQISQAAAWKDAGCNVWAPKYRQMGMLSMLMKEKPSAAKLSSMGKSLRIAFEDLERAFRQFLAQRPDKARPFIIAGHSQGAVLMAKVLKSCVENDAQVRKLFIAAYLCGAYFPLDLFDGEFSHLHACKGPNDTECIIAYDTRTAAFKPKSLQEIVFGFGLWPNYFYWLLFDKYCDEPTEKDDVGKARLQINPQTWTATGGGCGIGDGAYLFCEWVLTDG